MKYVFTLTIALIAAFSAIAQEKWPKTIKADDGTVIAVYEPQPEFKSGNEFTGRAAVSVRKSGDEDPVFGAMLFTAELDNPSSSGNINVDALRVTRLKFSGDENENMLASITQAIENDAPRWNWGMTNEQLEQSINKEKEATSGFNNAPPKIIYANKPTTLVVIDGDPRVLMDKNLNTDKVANTPNIIIKDNGRWNLYAGGNWYSSNSITGNWKLNNKVSDKLREIGDQIKKKEDEEDNQKSEPQVTDIVVTTQPAELIQTKGEPVYKNVSGTSLLYVSNSPNDIFKDIESQKNYIVIAGRWYRSSNLKGPWEYVPSDRLPSDFAKIPEGSDKDAVLANVAGTEAAETAILDASIPQTAKVDRRTASVNVEYDGEPYFVTIRGTSLKMAENSNVTVIRDVDGNYFALDNGIWFIADDAYGPWTVANDRPRDIDDIPASSPAYHSRYVYVYDYTPDYVYFGYTPGYLGSYVYGPTIIYGTGYHYRPWFRRVYYPRPFTWGFGFVYNPWYGWNINLGFNYGYSYYWYDHPAYYNYGYYGGWFGPHRYCPAYRRPYYGGYYGRGDYYYGRSTYRNRNYYGSATRPQRNYYGSAQNTRPSRQLGNNLYVNQQGVSTRNITRATRVYRPNEQVVTGTTTRPVNDRYNNRLSPRNNNTYDNNNSGTPRSGNELNTNRGNRIERNNDARRPEVRRPDSDNNNNNNGNLPQVNDDNRSRDARRPQLNRPQQNDNDGDVQRNPNRRELPEVRRPDNSGNDDVRRPQLNRPQQNDNNSDVQRNQNRRELPEVRRPDNSQSRETPRVQRPSYENRNTPSVDRSSGNRPQAPRIENRSSAPRPSLERPSTPSRPSIQRQQAPVSRPQGGNARPGGGGQSSRPDRR